MKETEESFRALLRTLGMVRKVMEPYFAGFGISGPQWAVMRNLYRAESDGEADLRLGDLGARLLLQPPSVTGVVDRLERLGYVARSRGKDDLRVRRVRLTAAGRALVERVLAVHGRQVEKVMGGLSRAEQADLARLLERLGGHLDALSREDRRGPVSEHSLEP